MRTLIHTSTLQPIQTRWLACVAEALRATPINTLQYDQLEPVTRYAIPHGKHTNRLIAIWVLGLLDVCASDAPPNYMSSINVYRDALRMLERGPCTPPRAPHYPVGGAREAIVDAVASLINVMCGVEASEPSGWARAADRAVVRCTELILATHARPADCDALSQLLLQIWRRYG